MTTAYPLAWPEGSDAAARAEHRRLFAASKVIASLVSVEMGREELAAVSAVMLFLSRRMRALEDGRPAAVLARYDEVARAALDDDAARDEALRARAVT